MKGRLFILEHVELLAGLSIFMFFRMRVQISAGKNALEPKDLNLLLKVTLISTRKNGCSSGLCWLGGSF